MLNNVRQWLRSHPRIYDLSVRARRIFGVKSATYDTLNAFSIANGRSVRSVQIGASDGLHSDPIREFIVRDGWSGVLVEPLPYSFARLKANYSYLQRKDLVFVNAAIVLTSLHSTVPFWTFSEAYLDGLSHEQRLEHIQKSSFNYAHVAGYRGRDVNAQQTVVEIPVAGLTVANLSDFLPLSATIDLLVTDCEGYEATLIPGINWRQFRPRVVLYESHNLGPREEAVNCTWASHDYHVFQLGGDSLAVTDEFLQDWHRLSSWASQRLNNSTPLK